jgi:hypothetical protein
MREPSKASLVISSYRWVASAISRNMVNPRKKSNENNLPPDPMEVNSGFITIFHLD